MAASALRASTGQARRAEKEKIAIITSISFRIQISKVADSFLFKITFPIFIVSFILFKTFKSSI